MSLTRSTELSICRVFPALAVVLMPVSGRSQMANDAFQQNSRLTQTRSPAVRPPVQGWRVVCFSSRTTTSDHNEIHSNHAYTPQTLGSRRGREHARVVRLFPATAGTKVPPQYMEAPMGLKPAAHRASISTRLGASRMSSVLGLKARPHKAMVLPSRSP